VFRAHFTKAFAAPELDPENSDPATPLTWDNIQNPTVPIIIFRMQNKYPFSSN